MTVPRPTPHLDGFSGEFYGHCARRELRFQRCPDCGAWRHPPRVRCPSCGSERWTWELSSGRGRVFTWTVTHRALHPAFADAAPYAVLVVELDEGVRLVAGARELPLAELALGLPVEVAFDDVGDGVVLPVFTPATSR